MSWRCGIHFYAFAIINFAENETGWNKIRDAVVIPVAVKTLLFVGKQIISLIPTGTASEQTQSAANA